MASSSPRRIQFFKEIALPITVQLPPESAEPLPECGEAGSAFAMRAAIDKAASLFPLLQGEQSGTSFLFGSSPSCEQHPPLAQSALQFLATSAGITQYLVRGISDAMQWVSHSVIAADTVVVHNNQLLGKPQSHDHAFTMLRGLAGNTHEVVTGCCIITPAACVAFTCSTQVTMWNCSDATLHKYIATGEPADKAGAYAIQGVGAFLVQSIHGSWSNVVGLPFAEVLQLLLTLGCVTPQ